MVIREDITGTWLLVARGHDNPKDDQMLRDRYGDNPLGILIISPDGWMNAALCSGSRPSLTENPAWHTDAPDADRLLAFDTYLSYGGRWTLEGDVFTTKVEFALNPGWVGGTQVRKVELIENGKLKLSLSREWPNGQVIHSWVQWRRP